MTEIQEHSHSLGALAKALAAAQGKLKPAKKDAINPHFRNRYATLAAIWEACAEVLPSCGLAVVQTTEPMGEGGICIVTMLLHESGEWIRGRLFIPVTKKDAQGFGSAISYGRRYALAAIVGVSVDDDDAEEAVKPSLEKQLTDSVEALAKFKSSLESAGSTGELLAAWNETPAELRPQLAKFKDARKAALQKAG